MYIYTYVCMHYMNGCIYTDYVGSVCIIYVRMYIYIHVCMYYMNGCIYTDYVGSVCMYVYMYVCIYLFMYICSTYVRIYVYE